MRDYQRIIPLYQYHRGTFRIGRDAQLVDNETQLTLASSYHAHAWLVDNCDPETAAEVKRLTIPPSEIVRSPIDDISVRQWRPNV